jgi:cobalt-precorrin 5A hydrolase
MGRGKTVIVAGLGCRRACPAEEILEVLRWAATAYGAPAELLAAPEFKRDEPGLRAAAEHLGLPLVFVTDAALAAAQPRCASRSEHAERATGHASVAEGSALAAAGPGSLLVLPRIANRWASCALAGVP